MPYLFGVSFDTVLRYPNVKKELNLPVCQEKFYRNQIVVEFTNDVDDSLKLELKRRLGFPKSYLSYYELGLGYLVDIPFDYVYIRTMDHDFRFVGHEKLENEPLLFDIVSFKTSVCYDGVVEDNEKYRVVATTSNKIIIDFKSPATPYDVVEVYNNLSEFEVKARELFEKAPSTQRVKMLLKCKGVHGVVEERDGKLILCGRDTKALREIAREAKVDAVVKLMITERWYDWYSMGSEEFTICVDEDENFKDSKRRFKKYGRIR